MPVKYLDDGTIIIENSCENFVFPVAAVEILKLPEYIVKNFLAKNDFVVEPSSLSTQSDNKLSKPSPRASKSRLGPSIKTRKNKKMFKDALTLPSIPKESFPSKEDFVVKPSSLSKPPPTSRSRPGPSNHLPSLNPSPKPSASKSLPPKEDFVVKPSSSSSSTRQSDKFSKAPASCRYNRVIQFQDANKLKKPFKIPRKVTVKEPEPEPVPVVCVQDEDANDGIISIELDKKDEGGLKTTSKGNPVPASLSTEKYESLPTDFSNFFIDDPHTSELVESLLGYPDPKQNDGPSVDVQQQDVMEVDKAGLLDQAIVQFLDDMENLGPQKGDKMDSTPTPPSIDESPDVFDAVNPEFGDSSEEESEKESEEPSTEVSEVSSSPKAAAARNLSDEEDQDVLQLCVDDDEFSF